MSVFLINGPMTPRHAQAQRMNFDLHLTLHTKSSSVALGWFSPELQWCSSTWPLPTLAQQHSLTQYPEHSSVSLRALVTPNISWHSGYSERYSGHLRPTQSGHISTHICSCTMCMLSDYWGKKKILCLLKLKVQVVMNCPMRVLGTKATFDTAMAPQYLVHLSLPARSYLVTKCSSGFLEYPSKDILGQWKYWS